MAVLDRRVSLLLYSLYVKRDLSVIVSARKYRFFVFAPMRYDSMHARKHGFTHALEALAARGVYVEFPGSRSRYHPGRGAVTLNSGRFRLHPPYDVHDIPGRCGVLAVPRKLSFLGVRFGLQERRMAPLIRAWLDRFFEHDSTQSRGPRAAVVTTARWAPFLRRIPFDAVIYDKTDIPNTLRGHYSLEEYDAMEREIVERSQVLIAASGPLGDALKAISGGREVTVIPNGVDMSRFRQDRLHRVQELEALPRPRLGLVATITDWIDTEWLGEAAQRYPSWSFVIVGPVSKTADMKPLKGLSNVHLLGKRPPEEVPSIVAGLDVCLHLLREGPVRDVNRSTKIWEYLALGKPLVCSWVPDLEAFDDLLYRSRDLSHFFENLRAAVEEDDPEKASARSREAAKNTWQCRVEDLFRLLDQASEQEISQEPA